MLRTWLEPEEIVVPDEYVHAISGSHMVSQVLYGRGYQDIESARGFLYTPEYHPAPPSDLPGLVEAAAILREAIGGKKRIGVWGDFDVDGQTATTLLVSGLRQLAGNVDYHIPVRAEESHGIGRAALEKFLERGMELVLTCDTGIAANEAIDYARQKGVPVIITDHHDLPEALPGAVSIVNPKFLPEKHPLSYLSGVGVAYKIVEELCAQSGQAEMADAYLDLVALGTVADIALLRGDNRYLVQRGLQALRSTQRAGLRAIMELAELNPLNLTEEHIGYILAPRMNALGRLDDANTMVELLTTADMGRARLLALELEGMNAQRKLLTDQVYQAALKQLDAEPQLLDDPVLILNHASWPAGVIGIVAARLVELHHRPVILLSSPPGQAARGSARSIEGVNITSVIAANQALVKSFGGHPMAAGLAMDPERIPELRRAISATVQSLGIEVQAEKELQVDGYLALPEITLELVEDLERLAPFGAGNPPLVFASRSLRLTGYVAIGRSGEHLQLTLEDELGHTRSSIWWQGAGYPLPEGVFDLAYSVRASTYRGQRDVQIEWIDYRPLETPSIQLAGKRRSIAAVDLRLQPDALTRLNELLKQGALVVWGEAQPKDQTGCVDRLSLAPAETMAIWTIPPGPNELQSALRLVNPKTVYLFGANPGMDDPEQFLLRLVGLLKFRMRVNQGLVSLPGLAAATAQRVETVGAALEWLRTSEFIMMEALGEAEARVEPGLGKKLLQLEDVSPQLKLLLSESAAYRRYYLSADKDRLIQLDEKME